MLSSLIQSARFNGKRISNPSQLYAEIDCQGQPIFRFATMPHLKSIHFSIRWSKTWPILLAILGSVDNVNVLEDIEISAIVISLCEWCDEVWATALANLDQQMNLVAANLKRVAIAISFEDVS
jgi:hypothetical protein